MSSVPETMIALSVHGWVVQSIPFLITLTGLCLSITATMSCRFLAIEGGTSSGVLLTGLFGYYSPDAEVCQSWSRWASAGQDITALHKFAQAAGIIACLLGFAATLLLFLSFFIRSLLTKCTWRIILPTLILTAGVFQLCTFALSDNCKCPGGYSGCTVTCTVQDGGIRSVAASVLYLLIGISIIFYPRRTTPLIGFVYTAVESNKTGADVEAPTMTEESPVTLRADEPFSSNGRSSLPEGRAITSQEQFIANWEDTNNTGTDGEASNITREASDVPRVNEAFVSNRDGTHEPSSVSQDRAISSQEQFITPLEYTSKARADVEAPNKTRDATNVPQIKEPFDSNREEAHAPSNLPQGRAISGQEQTNSNWEGTHESSIVPREHTGESSNGPHRHEHGQRKPSRGHHRQHRTRETSRGKAPQEAEGQE